jgi:AraC-like DNA-binding protein
MSKLIEIKALILRHSRTEQLHSPLAGLKIACTTKPGFPMVSIQEPCVALIVQGSKRTDIGNHSFQFCAGQILVVLANQPIVSQVTDAQAEAPYLAMAVELEPGLVAELLTDRPIPALLADHRQEPQPSIADEALLDPLYRLLSLLDHPQDVDVLLPMLKREIAWRLLAGPQGWLTRQISLGNGESSQVMRVMRWIRTHYSEPISVDALASMASMSLSSFYRHFERIAGTSPLQYQKQVRLQEARTQLLAGGGDTISIAYAVGYRSQSQFSREYRRMFGIAPMRDVRRSQSLRGLLHDVM